MKKVAPQMDFVFPTYTLVSAAAAFITFRLQTPSPQHHDHYSKQPLLSFINYR
jgi:hypothetical protein